MKDRDVAEQMSTKLTGAQDGVECAVSPNTVRTWICCKPRVTKAHIHNGASDAV